MSEQHAGQTEEADFVLRLRSVSSDRHNAPTLVRMRRLLKSCLRGFGFRVITISEDSRSSAAKSSHAAVGKGKQTND